MKVTNQFINSVFAIEVERIEKHGQLASVVGLYYMELCIATVKCFFPKWQIVYILRHNNLKLAAFVCQQSTCHLVSIDGSGSSAAEEY